MNFIPKLATDARAAGNVNISAGQFIITSDGKKIYFDISDSSRIQLCESSGGGGSVNKFTTTIGNGSSKTITVTHNLGTQDICVSAINATSKQNLWLDYTVTGDNTISLTFATAPATNSIKLTIVG